MNQYHYETVDVERPSNSLGVVGFCLMLLGWITCGILSVPALIVCGFAMFREPKGLAIAGFILSIPGVVLWVLFAIGGFVVPNLAEMRKNMQEKPRNVGQP